MNVDYLSVARKRRLTALEVLQRRQPALPGIEKLKIAPLQDGDTVVPFRERIIYQLDPEAAKGESLDMPMPNK